MANKRLKESLLNGDKFVVVAEVAAGPGYKFGPIEHILSEYKDKSGAGIPDCFDFAGITVPQNPGGASNIEPSDVLSRLRTKDLLGELDFVPHISCKDHNADALMSMLVSFKASGVESVLALTGDKPATSKGVFELGAMGLLQLINKINNDEFLKAKPEDIENVHQYFPGAAVSPFKYTESSQMQQYYKMENKITSGAKYLITQVGWDWRKSLELFQYIKDNNIDVPVLGNVYFLTTSTPAPRLMHDIKLPGCFVSDELLAKLNEESVAQHMERAAQQIAMYRAMGAGGVDLGGVHDYEIFTQILQRAAEIGTDWEQFKDNLYWPAEKPWYLYDEKGGKTKLTNTKKTMRHRFFKGMHRAVLDPDYKGFHANRKFMKLIGADKGKGFMYRCVFCGEKLSKYMIFDCEECGDCFLPENFGLCTIGECEKGLDNAPCGDSTVDGMCGNNLERICVGEKIYDAASSEPGGREKLRRTINPPRKPHLEGTSSVVNYVFGFDHTGKNPLITIGDKLTSNDPKVGAVMSRIKESNTPLDADSRQLEFIKAVINSQGNDGADYIMADIDGLYEENQPDQIKKTLMAYTALIRKYGAGASAYIRSSNIQALIGGIKEWYSTAEPVGPCLVGPVNIANADEILRYKDQFDFRITVNPVPQETDPKTSSPDSMFNEARKIFTKASKEYGFKADEIFFEIPNSPLAADMDIEPGTEGQTYRAFETIKKIKNDSQMKNTHCTLFVASCAAKLPRKVGVCRGYIAKAMEYGLDAGIMDTSKQFGITPPDSRIVEMVDKFAKVDGSADALEKAKNSLNKFCGPKKKSA